MPNPVISTCTTTKNIAKNPLSQRCSPKNVANVTAFDISRSKKTKKKLVLGLSNHHLIDVGAGCTTSLPETLLRRGKFTWLKYDEIVKSLLEYVEKSVILRSIEIYSGMLRCIEIYGDVLRLYDSLILAFFWRQHPAI